MAGEYKVAFGKFPWREDPVHLWPAVAKWHRGLRVTGFDADDYVLMGHVKTENSGRGHGGIRWGPSGWAWMSGMGKVFGQKTGTVPWSHLNRLDIFKDPFSILLRTSGESVEFVAVANVDGFAEGEMADVLVPRFETLAEGGMWRDATETRVEGPFGGALEARWERGE
jgi:hypothetical protein